MRNPDWVRDEVIFAMDLYFRSGRKQLPAEHEVVIQLRAFGKNDKFGTLSAVLPLGNDL